MGSIRHKAPLLLKRLIQPPDHLIQGQGKIVYFVSLMRKGDAAVQVACLDLTGRACEMENRPEGSFREPVAAKGTQQEHKGSNDEQSDGNALQRGRQLRQ